MKIVVMWVQQCQKPPIFDGWNPTHQNCDEWGMVYGIAMPTLYQNGGLMGFFGDAMEY